MRDSEPYRRRLLALARKLTRKRHRRLVHLAFEKRTTMYCLKRSCVMRRWSYDDHRNYRRRTHWQPDRTTRGGNDYNVVISNSRGLETLSALIAELGPRARAATAVEAAKAGDIVVVTVPLKNYRKVPVEPLAGKIVIDTNNYYPERDGHIPELDNESTTTSELLQAHLPTSKVVA